VRDAAGEPPYLPSDQLCALNQRHDDPAQQNLCKRTYMRVSAIATANRWMEGEANKVPAYPRE